MIDNKLDVVAKKLKIRFPISDISKKLDYSKGVVSEYFNNKKIMSENFKEQFENEYQIKFSDFEDSYKSVNEPLESYITTKNKGTPYFDIDFSLSFVEVQNNNQITPDAYITHPFFSGCDYVVRASGQSMAKLIKHGDAIGLIHLPNWNEFIPFGEVYAIVTSDGHRMVKVITKGDDDDHFTLISKPTDGKKDEFPPQQLKKSLITHLYKVQATSHLF